MGEEQSRTAQLARDTILQRPTRGIPAWLINPMEWRIIDQVAGEPRGTYEKEPVATYRKMLINSGCCMVDQWIPENPLSMKASGYHAGTERTVTTGNRSIELDGMQIDSPEAVVEHLERFVFPGLRKSVAAFDSEACRKRIADQEQEIQKVIGPTMLKVPYGQVAFPMLRYTEYGYENYFMAYQVYPEVIEQDFAMQADLAVLRNRAFVRACGTGPTSTLTRLDHDMADSRGTLVDVRSLDDIWFPHFARSVEPVLQSDIKIIWHCDGNLSAMVPRLLEAGLHGFQGFQYEDGMEYESTCRMTTRNGEPLIIIAGVSVTRTLPHGTPADVRREMKWLVDRGPERGLFLGASSSIAPGVPWENIKALIDGFHFYRNHGKT